MSSTEVELIALRACAADVAYCRMLMNWAFCNRAVPSLMKPIWVLNRLQNFKGRSKHFEVRSSKSFHIPPQSPPAALAICAMVFWRRRGGITSNLRRFIVRSSACFCRKSTQYNLYIAKAKDIISHSLFSHATSSQSSVFSGADGQKSSNCEAIGNDRGTQTAELT